MSADITPGIRKGAALLGVAGAVVLSVSTLIRQPLNNATLPQLSHLNGAGQLSAACALLTKAYTALALILLPVLGLLFVVANDVVEIVYTPSYLGAAPLMQLYLLGQMTMVLAAGHLLVLLNAGQLATTISAVCLTLSVALSLAGIHWIGLVGAVAGSVISLVVGEVRALMVVTRRLETTVLGVIHWRVTGRALGVIAAAMMGALSSRGLSRRVSIGGSSRCSRDFPEGLDANMATETESSSDGMTEDQAYEADQSYVSPRQSGLVMLATHLSRRSRVSTENELQLSRVERYWLIARRASWPQSQQRPLLLCQHRSTNFAAFVQRCAW